MAFLIALLGIALGIFFQSFAMAQAPDTNTPESSAKAFYTWFIQQDAEDRGYPLMNKDIYRFVSKPTVDFLRTEYKKNKFAERAEYFTRVQDYDQQDWLSHIAVHPAIMLDDVAVVPITFGSVEKKNILAFLRKQNGSWKITKIDDTQDDK
ncbi:hypothetical protein HDG34_005861 [Paraburkholderia sp. HC6.4b]|uniref:YbjP/YqhG family protein n=1 Tax=unclassified Paraburkholderia TaxID=2615204 RepID=UPI0017AED76F|nr:MULTISPECIES: YbjP/YqhG family protein [unclassified Paraburkholderia]MBB5411895.1 hypothetical protein [Paraburkholderia sp. HC6.4b]MBB5450207.1 hypothetical protein [Paraburkholderia sp. Kb1A]